MRERTRPSAVRGRTGKVTSQDVAERAGVSRSAVSRTFTPGAYVSEKVRTRVRRAADELGYLPNVLARSLIAGNSGLVALITGPIASPQEPILIEAVTRKLAEHGKRALLVPLPTSGIADESLFQALSYQVEAAIVFAGTVGIPAVEHCVNIGTRLTLFGRIVEAPGVNCVIYDNAAAADAAARLLVRGGHRRIAYIGTRHRTFSDLERRRAVAAVLEEHGLAFHGEGEGDYGHDSGYQAALAMLNAVDPPDAIYCSNDGMALGALDAARALGVRVPDDLAVVGMDDTPMAAWPAYRLTTWGIAPDAIAAIILRSTLAPLEQRGDDEAVPRVVRIPLSLALRSTTRRPGEPGAANAGGRGR